VLYVKCIHVLDNTAEVWKTFKTTAITAYYTTLLLVLKITVVLPAVTRSNILV